MVTNLHLHLLIDCTFDINSKSLNKTKQIFQQKTVPTKNDKTLNNKTVSNKYEGKMTKLSTKTDKALNKNQVAPSINQYRPILTQYHQVPTRTAVY